MKSMSESAIHDFEVPYPASPSGIASFSLGTPVILLLVLGRVATLAAGGLLQVVDLGASAATQHMHLLQRFPNYHVPFIIFPLWLRVSALRMSMVSPSLSWPNSRDQRRSCLMWSLTLDPQGRKAGRLCISPYAMTGKDPVSWATRNSSMTELPFLISKKVCGRKKNNSWLFFRIRNLGPSDVSNCLGYIVPR